MRRNLAQPLFVFGIAEWASTPETAFDAFLAGYQFEGRRLRASSFRIYQGMFKRLKLWALETKRGLFELDALSLETFLAGKSLSAETRHRYLLLFTTLFEHLARIRAGEADTGLVHKHNPARTLLLEREAPPRVDPDYLNETEIREFIAALPEGEKWKHLRDKAMAILVLGSGLRSGELLALRTCDLRSKNGKVETVWVQEHKPHPARQVPLHPWALDVLEEWLRMRESLATGKAPKYRGKEQRLAGDLLFPADLAGARSTPPTLFRLVKTTLEKAQLIKRYEGPTLLRNSCGALWLTRYEPLQVSLWLGHTKVSTTERLLPVARRRTKPDR